MYQIGNVLNIFNDSYLKIFIMKKEEKNISRRDALKRMSKVAVAVTVTAMLPNMDAFAYTDRCYADYTNYDNYTNHKDYSNYGNYRDYSNYRNYSNYNNYQNAL